MLLVRRFNLNPTSDRLCTVYITSFLMGKMELKIPALEDRDEDEVRKGPLECVLSF